MKRNTLHFYPIFDKLKKMKKKRKEGFAMAESNINKKKYMVFDLVKILKERTDSAHPMKQKELVERLALRQALDRLPEREARVVALRYWHGLTQDRAAKIIGVSQVQISRLEKKALAHLRELLEA